MAQAVADPLWMGFKSLYQGGGQALYDTFGFGNALLDSPPRRQRRYKQSVLDDRPTNVTNFSWLHDKPWIYKKASDMTADEIFTPAFGEALASGNFVPEVEVAAEKDGGWWSRWFANPVRELTDEQLNAKVAEQLVKIPTAINQTLEKLHTTASDEEVVQHVAARAVLSLSADDDPEKFVAAWLWNQMRTFDGPAALDDLVIIGSNLLMVPFAGSVTLTGGVVATELVAATASTRLDVFGSPASTRFIAQTVVLFTAFHVTRDLYIHMVNENSIVRGARERHAQRAARFAQVVEDAAAATSLPVPVVVIADDRAELNLTDSAMGATLLSFVNDTSSVVMMLPPVEGPTNVTSSSAQQPSNIFNNFTGWFARLTTDASERIWVQNRSILDFMGPLGVGVGNVIELFQVLGYNMRKAIKDNERMSGQFADILDALRTFARMLIDLILQSPLLTGVTTGLLAIKAIPWTVAVIRYLATSPKATHLKRQLDRCRGANLELERAYQEKDLADERMRMVTLADLDRAHQEELALVREHNARMADVDLNKQIKDKKTVKAQLADRHAKDLREVADGIAVASAKRVEVERRRQIESMVFAVKKEVIDMRVAFFTLLIKFRLDRRSLTPEERTRLRELSERLHTPISPTPQEFQYELNSSSSDDDAERYARLTHTLLALHIRAMTGQIVDQRVQQTSADLEVASQLEAPIDPLLRSNSLDEARAKAEAEFAPILADIARLAPLRDWGNAARSDTSVHRKSIMEYTQVLRDRILKAEANANYFDDVLSTLPITRQLMRLAIDGGPATPKPSLLWMMVWSLLSHHDEGVVVARATRDAKKAVKRERKKKRIEAVKEEEMPPLEW